MSGLISRKQAIEVVHKYFADAMDKTPYETDEDGYDVYTDMKTVNELLKHNKRISKAIKALPSVTPTERTGEWRKGYADELCLIATYTCSECGSMELSEFKYCPNCGAIMKGGAK